jgi:hypothetical protein
MSIETIISGFSLASKPISHALLHRIRLAYLAAISAHSDHQSSGLWSSINAKSHDIRTAITDGNIDRLAALLDDPGSNYLFYGFDNLFVEETNLLKSSKERQDARHLELLYLFNILAQSMGIIRIWNPEAGADYQTRPRLETIPDIINAIEELVGCPIDFPNPFPNEHGILTGKGICSHRACHAIYQAWRLKNLVRIYGGKVLEIGAGLGRAAYYAYRFGVTDYTIVDLPMANIAQANFLGRTVGEELVVLSGEGSAQLVDGVRIMTPDWFRQTDEKFDLVLNMDSMTEMTESAATEYTDFIRAKSKVFLSINHEANDFLIHQLPSLRGLSVHRSPYWLRPGYVEEIFLTTTST